MRTKTAAKILSDLEAKHTRLIARSVEIGDRLASLEYAIKSPAKSWRRRGPRSIRLPVPRAPPTSAGSRP
jgi:hypothetical protein